MVAVAAGLGLLSAILLSASASYGPMLAYAVFLGVGVGLFAAVDWAAAIDLLRSAQVAGDLRDHAVRHLTGDSAPNRPTHGGLALASAHPYATTALSCAVLHLPRDLWPFRLVSDRGDVPFDITGEELAEREVPDPFTAPSLTRRVSLRVLSRDPPPHGLRILRVERGEATNPPSELTQDGEGISNGLVSVHPAPGGIEVVDRSSGARILHTFQDLTDRGDEYNFCPLDGEDPRASGDAEVDARTHIGSASACLTLRIRWPLSRRLKRDRSGRRGRGKLEGVPIPVEDDAVAFELPAGEISTVAFEVRRA